MLKIKLGSEFVKKHRKDVLTREDLLQPPEQTEASCETKKKARIIGEIKEKRERNVKNFLKDDLTFEAAIYNEAVHYYSEGKWKDVDNSMTDGKDEAGNDVLENKDNDIKVKIAKKANSKKLVTIKKDKYQTYLQQLNFLMFIQIQIYNIPLIQTTLRNVL